MTTRTSINHGSGYPGILVLAFVLFSGISGCKTMNDQERTEAQGTAAGAFLGAVVGSVIGDNRKSVVIGAIGGALAGTLYGKHVAGKKQKYATEEDYMHAVIAEGEQALNQARSEGQSLRRSIVAHERQIENLQHQNHSASKKNQSLAELSDNLKKDIQLADTAIAKLDEEIKIQKSVLDSERQNMTPRLVSQSESQISKLEIEQRNLKLLRAQLGSLDTRRIY